MDGLVVILILVALALPVGAILGFIAFILVRDLKSQVDQMRKELGFLQRRLDERHQVPPSAGVAPVKPTVETPSVRRPPVAASPDDGVVAAHGARSPLLIDLS